MTPNTGQNVGATQVWRAGRSKPSSGPFGSEIDRLLARLDIDGSKYCRNVSLDHLDRRSYALAYRGHSHAKVQSGVNLGREMPAISASGRSGPSGSEPIGSAGPRDAIVPGGH